MKKVDIVGHTFGELVVLAEAPSRKSGNRNVRFVLTKCTCGTKSEIGVNHLRMGRTISCGCYRKEATGNRTRSHGESKTRLYVTWKNMRSRCNNPNNPKYEYYGGKGISVTSEWDNYITFAKWAKENGYEDHLTIERNNGNDNYYPTNCSWATRKQQANNRRPRRK